MMIAAALGEVVLKQDTGIMARFEQEAHSFVVRVWQENREAVNETPVWRGWVEYVPTGQRHYFQGKTKLCQIVSDYLGQKPILPVCLSNLTDE